MCLYQCVHVCFCCCRHCCLLLSCAVWCRGKNVLSFPVLQRQRYFRMKQRLPASECTGGGGGGGGGRGRPGGCNAVAVLLEFVQLAITCRYSKA